MDREEKGWIGRTGGERMNREEKERIERRRDG